MAETGGSFPVANFSAPVYLGKVTQDIRPGVDTVELTVPSTFADPEVKVFEDCAPKSFGNESAITATISGVPTGSTSATGIVATVGGFNVADYQFSLVNALSCAGAVYNSFQSISNTITATALADGNYSLCVIGRSARGAVQALPTIKSWTIDTSGAVATGISLASGVGNNSTPAITITGTLWPPLTKTA